METGSALADWVNDLWAEMSVSVFEVESQHVYQMNLDDGQEIGEENQDPVSEILLVQLEISFYVEKEVFDGERTLAAVLVQHYQSH